MSTPAGSDTPTVKPTGEQRVAKWFGLTGDNWDRHANPVSVATRFAVLPLLALSVWSRDWIGWWCLVPIVLSLVLTMVNPLLFAKPRSTRSWASRCVLGERVWSERDTVAVPDQFNPRVLNVTFAIQFAGLALLGYGLVELDVLDTVAGLLIMQTAKAWYLDRMVLLFED